MKPPSEQARRILDRFKESESLGAERQGHLLDVVQERVARGDLPRFDVQAPWPTLPKQGWPSRVWSSTAGKIGIAATVAAPVVVGYVVRKESVRPDTVVSNEAPRAPTAAATDSPPSDTSTSAPMGTSPPLAVSKPRSKADKASAAPNDVPAEPTIDEEVRLLNAAQASLKSGDASRALQLLNDHAARFPSSQLADARSIARMTALCELGQSQLARQEAQRFVAAHPGSPFADRARKICPPRDKP